MAKEYIEREAARELIEKIIDDDWEFQYADDRLGEIPAADVVEEENILKFYYVRSIDEYWIGLRIDNFYYAEYDPKSRQWVWTHSRYLPWGEHIVSPTSLWKEHTYPSEPEEIPFAEWLQGFIKKHAADVVEVVHAHWVKPTKIGWRSVDVPHCSHCKEIPCGVDMNTHYCPNCGARMDGGADDGNS